MEQGGYFKQKPNGKSGESKDLNLQNNIDISNSPSEITIYKDAILPEPEPRQNRRSTSSEEGLDTSDEMMGLGKEKINESELINNFISECWVVADDQAREQQRKFGAAGSQLNPRRLPMTTPRQPVERQQQQQQRTPLPPPPPRVVPHTPEDRAEQVIRQSEAAKARMVEVSGEKNYFDNFNMGLNLQTTSIPTAMVDEDYCLVAAQIDEGLRQRIESGEYIDFNRLLPREVNQEEDGRLELVYKDGQTYWVPANSSSRQNNEINGFVRWEQAFRVFSDIYSRRHPTRTTELIQYNHLINTAALTFSWENVYLYDREFRRHMARHPQHSWAIILQQAWMVRLKDRHHRNDRNQEKSKGGR